MTKHEAIRQLEQLGIPYMEDGASVEAARSRGTALHLSRRQTILLSGIEDEAIVSALAARGWEIAMRSASIRYEDEAPTLPRWSPASYCVVAVQPEATTIDVHATALKYRAHASAPLTAQGGIEATRHILIHELTHHIQGVCPEYSSAQAEEQIRLLTNAVLVNVQVHGTVFRGYQSGEWHR